MKQSIIMACLNYVYEDIQGQTRQVKILGHKEKNIFWKIPEDMKYFKERTMGKPINNGDERLLKLLKNH